jgi:hypothetical protein
MGMTQRTMKVVAAAARQFVADGLSDELAAVLLP